MLYLEHDFYSNFNSGIMSGDNDFITDMIVNELSEIIVYKRKSIIDLLEKVQLKLNDNVSDEKIINTIIDNLSKNTKLVKGLAFLIAQNNQSSKKTKIVKGADGKERTIKIGEKPATVDQIDMVASGIVGLGDSFIYKPQLKKEFKLRLIKLIETKSKAVGDRTVRIKDSKSGGYWLLAILVVGAGIGIYFYLKNKKKIAAEGLAVDGVGSVETPKVEVPTINTSTVETPATPIDSVGNNI